MLTNTVAEHTIALMLSITSRIAEGDRLVRSGKFKGWAPMMLLGIDIKGKTLGILGAGRIGRRVAYIAHNGLGMHIIYNDIAQNIEFEKVCHPLSMMEKKKYIYNKYDDNPDKNKRVIMGYTLKRRDNAIIVHRVIGRAVEISANSYASLTNLVYDGELVVT